MNFKIINPKLPDDLSYHLNIDGQICHAHNALKHMYGEVEHDDKKNITIVWKLPSAEIKQIYLKLNHECIIQKLSYEDFDIHKYEEYLNSDIARNDKQYWYEQYINKGILNQKIYNNFYIKNNRIVHTIPNDFDAATYRLLNADLSRFTNNTALTSHYINHGIYENRQHNSLHHIDFRFNTNQPVFINHDSSLTGAPIFLYDLVEYLVQNKLIINPIIIEPYPNNIFNNYSTAIQKLYHYNDPIYLKLILDNINPVFIYNNSVSSFFYNIDLFEQFYDKTIFHFHESIENIQKNNLDKIKHCTIFTVADRIKAELEGFGCTNVSVFPPFITDHKANKIKELADIDKTHTTKNHIRYLNRDKVIIGMCGSICDRKGFKTFYDIAKQNTDKEFIWIGGQEQWTKTAYQVYKEEFLELSNFFHIPQTDNPYHYYNDIDYFFLTSKNDPCPIVVLENLFLGNRVISINKNIFYDHSSYLSSSTYIDIESADQFNSLVFTKKKKPEISHIKYIKNNFQLPKICVSLKQTDIIIVNYIYENNLSTIDSLINLLNYINIKSDTNHKKNIIAYITAPKYMHNICIDKFHYIQNIQKIYLDNTEYDYNFIIKNTEKYCRQHNLLYDKFMYLDNKKLMEYLNIDLKYEEKNRHTLDAK